MPEENSAETLTADAARTRLKRLFEFLRALDERKNPIPLQIQKHRWSLPLDALPPHPAVQVFRGAQPDADPTCFLRVARPKLTKAPKPPNELAGWLDPRWDQWKGSIEVVASRSFPGSDGRGTVVAFVDDQSRVAALNQF